MDNKSSLDMFRERIELLRSEYNETTTAFARRCGISPNTLSNLKTRGKTVPYDLLEQIANTCNVSLDWLVGRTEVREVAEKDADSAKNAIDYVFLSYGEVYSVLAFLSALNYLQIVEEADGVILRVHDKNISNFLSTLQKLARMAVGNRPLCEALKTWIDKEFSNMLIISAFGCVNSIDKYNGAFPWEYDKPTSKIDFNFSNSQWLNDSPANEWDYEREGYYDWGARPTYGEYDEYSLLNDGITGYYDSVSKPKPPKEKTSDEDIPFMIIPQDK